MLVLESYYFKDNPEKVEKYKKDGVFDLGRSGSEFDNNPLYDQWAEVAGKDYQVYIVKHSIIDCLSSHNAQLVEGSGDLYHGDNTDLSCCYNKNAEKAVVWLDNILAYTAFHNGFLGSHGPLRIDVTHQPHIFAYETISSNTPETVIDWFDKAEAWRTFIKLNSMGDKSKPITIIEHLQAVLRIFTEEMGMQPHYQTLSKTDYIIEFPFANHNGSIRFWSASHDADIEDLKMSVSRPGSTSSFPVQPTIEAILNLFMNEIFQWVNDFPSHDLIERFEKQKQDIQELIDKPFVSGLPPLSAEVIELRK